MDRALVVCACMVALALPGVARADEELTALEAVHEACDATREHIRPHLYAIEVEYRLGVHRADRERLYVDTRRNLRALEGHVSLMISGLEPIAFEAGEEQAAALREAASSGARLRVGFFLGFDEPSRQPCLVRGAHAVTIVRADLAYAELVTSGGEPLARMETDRLRSWLDDQGDLAIPGEGPRGAVGAASFDNAQPPPDAWQRALSTSAVRARIGQCHAEGTARGAASEGQVVIRMNVETRTGRVRRADVAISSLGDGEEAECIARALGTTASLPAGPAGWAEVVDLSVPVRVTSD